MSEGGLSYYINGSFVGDSDAKISVLDRSFLYGDAVFEGICVWSGRVIHLDDHLHRLQRSARVLRIPLPTFDELREIVLETGARNEMADIQCAQLRLQVTRGNGQGVVHASADLEPNIVVIPQLHDVPDPYSLTPRRAVMSSFVRPGATVCDPRIKTTSYASTVMAYLEAADQGAHIAILRDDRGFVAEGQTMNIFCVSGEALRCPREVSALAGITRHHVIETARMLGFSCVERELTSYDLACADELFATSTSLGLMPIESLGGVHFDIRAPGPIARKINDAYVKRAIETSPPIPAALTTGRARE